MKERPILFSGAMVCAILEGRKTMTRRVVKVPVRALGSSHPIQVPVIGPMTEADECPYGKPGGRLWVREALTRPDGDRWLYAADKQPVMVSREDETEMFVWAHHKEQAYCSSRYMPRWASRITLAIACVRVERLRQISEEDAKAEGVSPVKVDPHGFDEEDGSYEARLARALGLGEFTAKFGFMCLWDLINGKRAGCSWFDNPWVWVIEFKRVKSAS